MVQCISARQANRLFGVVHDDSCEQVVQAPDRGPSPNDVGRDCHGTP